MTLRHLSLRRQNEPYLQGNGTSLHPRRIHCDPPSQVAAGPRNLDYIEMDSARADVRAMASSEERIPRTERLRLRLVSSGRGQRFTPNGRCLGKVGAEHEFSL